MLTESLMSFLFFISSFFHVLHIKDVDLVASDIVAGLFLLRWQTKQWVGTGHRIPLSLIYQDTSPSDLNVDILVKGDQVSITDP